MTYKIFIIDDNHSLVDSLKVMLKDLPLQYESAFRFQDARNRMTQRGCYFNNKSFVQLHEISQKMKEQEEAEQPAAFLELVTETIEDPIKEDGLFMVLIEHDTENNTKGIDFIQNILRVQDCWEESDFVLMTSRPEVIHKKAQESKIQLLEKPIQYEFLRQIILQKIQMVKEKEQQIHTLSQELNIQKFPVLTEEDRKAKPKPKRRTRAKKNPKEDE